jgi:hypothetical protein
MPCTVSATKHVLTRGHFILSSMARTTSRVVVPVVVMASAATAAGEETKDKDAAPKDEAGEEPAKPEWQLEFSGYFRAPIMIGVSERPSPGGDDRRELQLSYAPNRVVDGNYNSFAYTRLQEGDWAELYVTAKRPHVSATLAFMGYWYTWAGYESPNAAWVPAQAWVDLDTNFQLGELTPHVTLKGGVFWQRWGMFEKYDTYLFGRFHQAGAALELEVPFTSEAEARFVQGFGTNRNGAPSVATGLTLLHYTHVGFRYGKVFDVGLYHDFSWTRDPAVFVPPDTPPDNALPAPGPAGEPGGGPYVDAQDAHMRVYGADLNLRVPHVGHAWLAASRIDVRNGWALPAIIEVVHSPGAAGIANNYLGYGEAGSTGSGSLSNVALLYETSVRGLRGDPDGTVPDLALSVFGMMVHARRDLGLEATMPSDLEQFKWGSDLTLKMLPWLAVMLRYDSVDLDTERPGQAFRALTPRVIFTSHALATESIWLSYSRYFYDGDVELPTSTSQPYPRPDRNVIKLQANLSF